MKKQQIVLLAAVVMALVFVAGGYFYKSQQSKRLGFMAKEHASLFVPGHSKTLGADDAKVYLVEFFDPGCETCRVFARHVKGLMAAYPGKIKLVYRYAPFHHGADTMVKILEASRKQGKYSETLQIMFDSQPYWANHQRPNPEAIWEFLPRAGMDPAQLRRDMNAPAIAELIRQDIADARTLNVRKTPEFFVNGRPLPSFGYEQLKALVKEEIAANY